MGSKNKKHEFAVIATDIVIFAIIERAIHILLIKAKKARHKGLWAVPGGLVKPSESVDSSAKRNLIETTEMKDVHLEQLYTFGAVDRDPYGRVVSVAYFALIPSSDAMQIHTKTDKDKKWYPIDCLPELAYDHEEVIHHAVERLKAKLAYTNIAYSLLPDKFTLSELQNVYEIVLQKKLDKRNFRKKVRVLNMLVKTGEKTSGQAHRPADLYGFTHRRPTIVQIL